MSAATEDFHRICEEAINCLLAHDPVRATWLGDHRFDSALPDMSVSAMQSMAQSIDDLLTVLDAVDDLELETHDLVDLEIMRAQLMRVHFEITQVKSYQWNPMLWNPGNALNLLLTRDFAPETERLENARSRALRIPEFLHSARETLENMPAIHVETAIAQLHGTLHLVQSMGLPPEPSTAIEEHIAWLEKQLPDSHRSPRLGSELYAGVLWHTLDAATDVSELYATAHRHLDSVTAAMQEVAVEYMQTVGGDFVTNPIESALDHIASQSSVTNANVLQLVESALVSCREFTIAQNLVRVPDIQTEVIEMPEIHRGVAVAYCDAPGPLEKPGLPTYVAVAPTPADWSVERQISFFREYNDVQIHDLTIHETFPGHVLQLALSNADVHLSVTRRFGMSGVFVEGWAVYVEELMIAAGYSPQPGRVSQLAIRLQQLKMQARMTINAILDIGVHSRDMSESEAMELMQVRGFQEESEAVGKWKRALLTAGQLPTYFVGYLAIKELVHDLRVMHPDWPDRQIHDLMLSFGAPAPRHLRELVGL